MRWNLILWNRSRSNRPHKQSNTRLFESLENLALMAGDLHALHAPPSAPAPTSGTGRVGYVVQYSTDSGAPWTTVNHQFRETRAVIPMLTAGTSYVFEVAAVNKAGQSAFSDMSASVTPVSSATPPTSGRNRGNARH